MTRARRRLTRARRKLGNFRARLGACYDLYQFARYQELFKEGPGVYWDLVLDMIDIMRAKII